MPLPHIPPPGFEKPPRASSAVWKKHLKKHLAAVQRSEQAEKQEMTKEGEETLNKLTIVGQATTLNIIRNKMFTPLKESNLWQLANYDSLSVTKLIQNATLFTKSMTKYLTSLRTSTL